MTHINDAEFWECFDELSIQAQEVLKEKLNQLVIQVQDIKSDSGFSQRCAGELLFKLLQWEDKQEVKII